MKWLSDALLLAGALTIAGGVACIYWPAGIICAGLFMICAGLLVAYTGTMTPGKRNVA